jgi:hypothetical protein
MDYEQCLNCSNGSTGGFCVNCQGEYYKPMKGEKKYEAE